MSLTVLETSTSPGFASCDASADVYGDATYLSIDDFAFTSVQAGPNLDAELAHGIGNCTGAADRSCRTVERSEEAVAGGVQLLALEASELTTNQRVVAVERRG